MSEFWATEHRDQQTKIAVDPLSMGLGFLAARAKAPLIAPLRRVIPQSYYSNQARKGFGQGYTGLDNSIPYRRALQTLASPMATGMVDHEVGAAAGGIARHLMESAKSDPKVQLALAAAQRQSGTNNPEVLKALYTNKVPGMTRGMARNVRAAATAQLPPGSNIPRFVHHIKTMTPESQLGATVKDMANNPKPIPMPTTGRTGANQQRGAWIDTAGEAALGAVMHPAAAVSSAAGHIIGAAPDEVGLSVANRGATKTIQALKEKILLGGMKSEKPTGWQRFKETASGVVVDPTVPEFRRFGRDMGGALRALNPNEEAMRQFAKDKGLVAPHAPTIAGGIQEDVTKLAPNLTRKVIAPLAMANALRKANPNFG